MGRQKQEKGGLAAAADQARELLDDRFPGGRFTGAPARSRHGGRVVIGWEDGIPAVQVIAALWPLEQHYQGSIDFRAERRYSRRFLQSVAGAYCGDAVFLSLRRAGSHLAVQACREEGLQRRDVRAPGGDRKARVRFPLHTGFLRVARVVALRPAFRKYKEKMGNCLAKKVRAQCITR